MNLRNRIAATIRHADGNHTMGAAALADTIADDLQNMPALLPFALRDAFNGNELSAIRLMVTRSEFRDLLYMRRLHAAVCEAIDGEA